MPFLIIFKDLFFISCFWTQFEAGSDLVYARFTRPAELIFTNPDTGSAEQNYLDLESFYLGVAYGAVMGGSPGPIENAVVTVDPVIFSEDTTTTTVIAGPLPPLKK